jgi:hypothetical protein
VTNDSGSELTAAASLSGRLAAAAADAVMIWYLCGASAGYSGPSNSVAVTRNRGTRAGDGATDGHGATDVTDVAPCRDAEPQAAASDRPRGHGPRLVTVTRMLLTTRSKAGRFFGLWGS